MGAVCDCASRLVQIPRLRGYRILDHVGGFAQRSYRPLPVRTDSAQPAGGRNLAQGVTRSPGSALAAVEAAKSAAGSRLEIAVETASRGQGREAAHAGRPDIDDGDRRYAAVSHCETT